MLKKTKTKKKEGSNIIKNINKRNIISNTSNTNNVNNANNINNINNTIANNFIGMATIEPYTSFALVFLTYIALTKKIDNANELLDYIGANGNKQRERFIKEVIGDNAELAVKLSKSFPENDLLTFLFEYPRENSGREFRKNNASTPESISKLVLGILDIKDGDSVADFGSGSGDFLLTVGENVAGKKETIAFYGIESDIYSYEISKIRLELFMDTVELEMGDMFELSKKRKFKKIFSNYPFGMRTNNLQTENGYIHDLYMKIPEMKKYASADWIYNSLIVDHLSEEGKAVTIMTNGSSKNVIARKIREYFISEGYIEAVIALPSKLFDYTSIPTTMLVLSKNNDSVRMIDATNLYRQGRRQNTFSEENINHIVKLLSKDTDESVTISLKTLLENDCVLNPARYLNKVTENENDVEFGSLMKRITRGAQIAASKLDGMVSEKPTDTQYLMLANIQDGMILENLPYLKEIDSKLYKYCIGNRNLLLSKNGLPFKVAVAKVEDGRKLLGNGNLFIIELDESKVNPYYIKAFFDSELGENALKAIAGGETIQVISAEALKKMVVPLPPIEKQNEIAGRYMAKQDEIKELQHKIKKAEKELHDIFGEMY